MSKTKAYYRAEYCAELRSGRFTQIKGLGDPFTHKTCALGVGFMLHGFNGKEDNITFRLRLELSYNEIATIVSMNDGFMSFIRTYSFEEIASYVESLP